MELKQIHGCTDSERYLLLIVPYGIETEQSTLPTSIVIALLIVPYGIETLLNP